MSRRDPHNLTESDLIAAHNIFQQHESRDLFYRAARELVRLALAHQTEISVSEALGTLLQTWNRSFYRFHGTFDESHIRALERVIEERAKKWEQWRLRAIDSVGVNDWEDIAEAFTALEAILGPVGAAKALHLLSPEFFPLWDRAIARGYGVGLRKRGLNARQYGRFMAITKEQVIALGNSKLRYKGILKLIDEYNYAIITKGWIRPA